MCCFVEDEGGVRVINNYYYRGRGLLCRCSVIYQRWQVRQLRGRGDMGWRERGVIFEGEGDKN